MAKLDNLDRHWKMWLLAHTGIQRPRANIWHRSLLTPRCGHSFEPSTIQTNFFATTSTIFSRRSAPPPPLTRSKFWSTLSAPSIATSSSGTCVERMQCLRGNFDWSHTMTAARALYPRSPAGCSTIQPASVSQPTLVWPQSAQRCRSVKFAACQFAGARHRTSVSSPLASFWPTRSTAK
eukprot:SAG31_NODE_9513_length_1266_cov_1.698372_2_plen_179_part_00